MTGRTADERRADNRGTAVIVAGTAVSALSVLAFEIIAGRALGADAFAPIGVLWTVNFLIYTVLMLPVEQLITRTLVVAGGAAESVARHVLLILAVLGAALALGVLFSILTLERFFDGDPAFIVIVALLMVVRGVLAVGRGFLAGRRRFTAYGVTIALEGISLVFFALVAAAAFDRPAAFGGAMVLAPLTVFLVRPFRSIAAAPAADDDVSASMFLGWLLVATAASQMILAGGPIVVGLIGGSPAAVSIFFVTFTLFRGPITSAYNLVARVLPDFTEMARRGRSHELHTWSWRLVVGGFALAAASFGAAAFLGPLIVTTIYGTEFEPTALVAGLGGAGVGAGLAVLFIHQIYVAKGNTRSLALRWLTALALAGAAVVVVPDSSVMKVAAGFATGEIAALLILGVGVAAADR